MFRKKTETRPGTGPRTTSCCTALEALFQTRQPRALQTGSLVGKRLSDGSSPSDRRYPRRTAQVGPRPETEADGKKLTVGREICLSGEISSCDTLVVEGRVEATLHNAQVIDVAPSGLFKGEATVREAQISGRFEGTLTARDVLTVRPGGKVGGKIRYGRIVIESGGEVAGEMRSLAETEET